MKIKAPSFLKAVSLSICLFALLGLVATGTVSATTYYVAPSGADNSDGSSAHPFKTIQRAADIVKAGDTVIVRNGTYYAAAQAEVLVQMRISGTANSPITFKAENTHGAVLDGNNSANEGIVFSVNDLSYIKIEGFEIKNFRWFGISSNPPGLTNNPVTHITIFRNYIHDIGRRNETGNYGMCAIYCHVGSHHWTIDSNKITNIGRTGTTNNWLDQVIYLCGYSHTLTNNLFYTSSPGWTGACISVSAEYNPGVDGNDISIINNTFDGLTATDFSGHIWVDFLWGTPSTTIYNLLISNNISYNPRRAMVRWVGDEHNKVGSATIRNNLVNVSSVDEKATDVDITNVVYSNNLINTNPQFANIAAHDYHLGTGSPAIGTAYPADTPNHDYDQRTRPGGVGDVGAYIYVGADPPPPPPPPPSNRGDAAAIMLLLKSE